MSGSLILAGVLALGQVSGAEIGGTAGERPRVEVVFVLDTTGSMSGLIDGAKKKIWSIANKIALGKPTPDLRIGLVGYRDKGDAYVTRVLPLTDDLDKVYGDLCGFTADGGGDGPENVRQALQDALAKVDWSADERTLKIIFLVGDAPPHLDYSDVPTVADLCERAARSAIIINTVRCGGDPDTGRIWKEIALKAEGKFMTIDSSGGVVTVPTPFDEELGSYSDRLGKTMLPFGDPKARQGARETEERARGMAAAPKADRAAALGLLGRGGTADLVDAVLEGRVKLEEVKEEHLPEAMRGMTAEERREHIEKKAKEREEIREKVLDLSKKRDAYIAKELASRGVEDAFDQVVTEVLREQAKDKGIRFGEE